MSVVLDIIRTYRAPREVQGRRMANGPREDRALAVLLAGCAVIFVSQWPRLARESHFDPSIGLDARLAGALFAWLMVMPLVFYAASVLLTLIFKAFGAGISGFQCRMALFWALLASGPVWLFAGLLAGFAPGGGFAVVSSLALVVVLVFAIAGLLSAQAIQRGVV